jgi:hypothetical protein
VWIISLGFVGKMEIERCISWAVLHGLVVSNNGQDGSMIHAPISLLPYQFPKDSFHHAKNLAPFFNLLVHRVASNSQWLLQTLENVFVSLSSLCSLIFRRPQLMTPSLEDS